MIFWLLHITGKMKWKRLKGFYVFFSGQFNLIELEGKNTLTVLLLCMDSQYKLLNAVSVPSQYCRFHLWLGYRLFKKSRDSVHYMYQTIWLYGDELIHYNIFEFLYRNIWK